MTSVHILRSASMRAALLTALAILLAAGTLLSSASIWRTLAAEPTPTIVLVHGAWASPPGWDQLRHKLEADGYATVAPELSLLSIGLDATIVASTLDSIPGDKVLVAHSYGGIVASNASYGRTDVAALVFTAAFVPDAGDSIASLGAGFQPSAVLDNLAWIGEPYASLAFIDRDAFRTVFASDLSPKKAQALNDGQKPASPALLFEPSGAVGWHAIPSWYAVSGADVVIDPAQQRWMAGRAGSTSIEFPAASHVGGYTHYVARFADLIGQAVATTR